MPLHDLNTFFRLSADLNYQLSANEIDWYRVNYIVLDHKRIPPAEEETLLLVYRYLADVYGRSKRKLGALAVLHPLRVAALMARTFSEPQLLDLLTALLHDRFEDIHPEGFNPDNLECVDNELRGLIERLSSPDQWFLMERLHWMTKTPKETYYQYVGRLLTHAARTPEVVRVKLADRLDNTLDLRIDMQDPLQEIDFFESLFQIIFLPQHHSFEMTPPLPRLAPYNGAQQLYQLFKNITLMTLIRQKKSGDGDPMAGGLFDSLNRASIQEAQRVILMLSSHFSKNRPRLRALVMETLEYVRSGGIDAVTTPGQEHRLDGLLVSRFDDAEKKSREDKLAELYADKELMVEAALAFIVIFYSFLNNPGYYVRGISETGIHPQRREEE